MSIRSSACLLLLPRGRLPSGSKGWAGPGFLPRCVIRGALVNLSGPRRCHPANDDDYSSTYLLVLVKDEVKSSAARASRGI